MVRQDYVTRPQSLQEWRSFAWVTLFVTLCGTGYLFVLGLSRPALIVAVFGGTIATILSPAVGLFLLVASFPFAGLTLLIPGALTLVKGIGMVVGFSTLLRIGRIDIRSILRARTFRLYIAILVWSLLLVPFTSNFRAAMLAISVEVLMVSLAFLIVAILRTSTDIQRLSFSLMIGAAALSAYAAIAGFSESMSRSGARLSAGMNENQIAAVLGSALLLSFVGLAARRVSRMVMFTVIALDCLIILALGFTFSRGAIVALTGAVVLGPLITRGVRLGRRAVLTIALSSLVLIGLTTAYVRSPAIAQKQVARRMSGEGESISSGRLDFIWPSKIREFIANPVMGNGPGGNVTTGKDAHNDFLFFLSERGLIGGLLFLALVWAMLSEAQRVSKPGLRVTLVMLILFTLGMGLTHTTFLTRPFALVVGLISAIVAIGISTHSPVPGVRTRAPLADRQAAS